MAPAQPDARVGQPRRSRTLPGTQTTAGWWPAWRKTTSCRSGRWRRTSTAATRRMRRRESGWTRGAWRYLPQPQDAASYTRTRACRDKSALLSGVDVRSRSRCVVVRRAISGIPPGFRHLLSTPRPPAAGCCCSSCVVSAVRFCDLSLPAARQETRAVFEMSGTRLSGDSGRLRPILRSSSALPLEVWSQSSDSDVSEGSVGSDQEVRPFCYPGPARRAPAGPGRARWQGCARWAQAAGWERGGPSPGPAQSYCSDCGSAV